ncbi:MAG TPA: hypothetical protein VJT54_12700 [Verrucomicrobiae bacterium]|nr:hypothetical protein [Verrucomicrobiae bacterium]
MNTVNKGRRHAGNNVTRGATVQLAGADPAADSPARLDDSPFRMVHYPLNPFHPYQGTSAVAL